MKYNKLALNIHKRAVKHQLSRALRRGEDIESLKTYYLDTIDRLCKDFKNPTSEELKNVEELISYIKTFGKET